MSRTQWLNKPQKKTPAPGGPRGCRVCHKPLTTPATVKRRLCRSCWRRAKVVTV